MLNPVDEGMKNFFSFHSLPRTAGRKRVLIQLISTTTTTTTVEAYISSVKTAQVGSVTPDMLHHSFQAWSVLVEHFLDEQDLCCRNGDDGQTFQEGPPLDASICCRDGLIIE